MTEEEPEVPVPEEEVPEEEVPGPEEETPPEVVNPGPLSFDESPATHLLNGQGIRPSLPPSTPRGMIAREMVLAYDMSRELATQSTRMATRAAEYQTTLEKLDE